MNVQDRIKKAHISIMQHKKFCAYSGILACGKVTVSDVVPTAATDGWNVAYNPKFVEEHAKTDPELRFLVLHEATHKAYRHMTTWRALHEQDARLANIAADHFVNLTLQDTDAGEGFIKMLKLGVPPTEKYRGWSVQQIFNDLKQQQQQQQQQDGDGGGGEGDDPENPDGQGGGFDEHDWNGNEANGDPAKEQQQADEIQRAIRQGEIMRKKLAGKGAGGEDGVFGDLMAPKIDWRKVLREFVTETCSGRDESSWRKPNRRYLGMDIYMPSMVGTTMTELVIGFDTSGSIFGGEEMTRFVTEIKTIVEDVKPSKVHVIYWDTRIAGHQTFEDGQFAVQDLKIKGGGGTDGSVLFDYLREKHINPQAIVQFTDGYVGDWGRTDVPTLWAVTSDLQAPFGTTIKVEV
jgi:predicted metal-dependent peptidase